MKKPGAARACLAIVGLAAIVGGLPLAQSAEEVSVTDPRVFKHEYEFEMTNSYQTIQGGFDPYGNYQSYPAGTTAWSWTTALGAQYRFTDKWEGMVMVPLRYTTMETSTGTSESKSLGGAVYQARYHLGLWPHLILHLAVGTPWSFSDRQSTGDVATALPTDLGDNEFYGGTSFRFGVGASRSIKRFRFALDATTSYSLPTTQVPQGAPAGSPSLTLHSGARNQLMEGVGYQLLPRWSVNAGVRELWMSSSTDDGVIVPDSAARSVTSNLGVMYAPNGSWHYTLSYMTQYPFYAFEVNQAYSPAISVGMTYVGL